MLEGEALAFFREHTWQKVPALFESAIDITGYPLTAEVLADLTTNDYIESRMISADGDLLLGPFEHSETEGRLLPEGWLLLVQCLEQHLETMNSLISEQFGFMARWQVDDVMASVGDSGASCGAHFDHYDVFLLQHTGTKTWLLDDGDHQDEDLVPDSDVRLLQSFNPTRELTAKPGDVLYVPAGVGHHGVCVDESLTLSVGIRNPTSAELLDDVSTFMLSELSHDTPFDSGLHEAGPLPPGLSDNIRKQLINMMTPDAAIKWYGCYVTRLREPALLAPLNDVTGADLSRVSASLASRLTFAESDDAVLLFVNGECFTLPPADLGWIQTLCTARTADIPGAISDTGMSCLQELILAGAIYAGPLP